MEEDKERAFIKVVYMVFLIIKRCFIDNWIYNFVFC